MGVEIQSQNWDGNRKLMEVIALEKVTKFNVLRLNVSKNDFRLYFSYDNKQDVCGSHVHMVYL